MLCSIHTRNEHSQTTPEPVPYSGDYHVSIQEGNRARQYLSTVWSTSTVHELSRGEI